MKGDNHADSGSHFKRALVFVFSQTMFLYRTPSREHHNVKKSETVIFDIV
jgi:hypothetical protein